MTIEQTPFDERDAVPLHRRRKGSTELAMATFATPLYRIVDGVYLSHGTTNAHLVTTADGDVVISTGLAVEGPIHRAKFDEASRAPVKHIILTQAHLDIVGGTNAFKGPESEVIAHRASPACQADDVRIQAFRNRRNPRFFPNEVQSLNAADAEAMAAGMQSVYTTVAPDVAVDGVHRFAQGGVDFEVIALPGGETLDSLAVWLPQRRILFTGNAMGPLFPHMPNLHTIRGDRPRPVLPYLATYQRILDIEPDILVTGHFNPIRGRDFIREEITRLRDAVQYVHDETVRGMNEGKSLDQLKREIRLPPELEVGQDYGTVIWDVEAIWYGYAGWFHYRSTTELYDVPAHAMHAEIAALAGPEALGRRARALAAEGKPLEAIHLAEIALAGDPAEGEALAAHLAAHEALLAAAPPRNRWYQYWLKGEIEATRGKLAAVGAPA
ncbi:MBL fold metallo-hydrolase [Flavisphingomonas formosensis]|uniref:MBL fold metallo-hydrolase n=1 Tax=Flavisphingomonas formosensis TaxID=861534 RepID=UPI0012FA0499|nr:MBL fold metallo-hydrolase [Sphingomonas formosensis]